MALSNMLNEPRREIVETVVGIAAAAAGFALLILYEYLFVSLVYLPWLCFGHNASAHGNDVNVGTFVGIVALGASFLLLIAIHALGDAICSALQRRDIHLRPRVRR